VLVGVPEVGLVGAIAASYLVERLELPEIASVASGLLPPVVVVRDSEPKPPIRIFGKDSLAIVVSEIPLVSLLTYEFASQVVEWCKAKQSKMVIGVTGLPSEARAEATSDSKPAEVPHRASGKQGQDRTNLGVMVPQGSRKGS
jgi:uncharacterized protein